jgi:hypothetical protein
MSSIVHRGAVAAIAAAAALAGLAGVAEAKTLKGVVVHHNRNAHSFVVADRAGHLYAIHGRHAPRIGSEVVVTAKRLRDGTYRLQREHSAGRAGRAVRIRGVVSWVNRRTGEFTISAPGVSLLVVHSSRRAARAADAMPSVGTEVVATGAVDDQGELEDQAVQEVGQDTDGVDLEGTVLSIDTTARTITVSADDNDESGSSIIVSVPATLDLSQFTQGEEVELKVQPTGAGTATLLGSADDENAQTADDQGDDQGENPGSDDRGEESGSGTANTTTGSGGHDD